MASIERFQTAERDFMAVAAKAGLPEPDEVSYREEADEIEFLWHEQKLAVVVELDDLGDGYGDPVPDIPF